MPARILDRSVRRYQADVPGVPGVRSPADPDLAAMSTLALLDFEKRDDFDVVSGRMKWWRMVCPPRQQL